MNARFVTVDMAQLEDALQQAEQAMAKLRKVIDRYSRAAEAARRAFDGNAVEGSPQQVRAEEA